MSTTRVIYQAEGLYVSPSPSTGFHYVGGTVDQTRNLVSGLNRVQDISYGFTIPLKDVNQFGELAAIDRIPIDQPTVNLSFSYLQNGLYNEKLLGFYISSGTQVSAINNFLNGSQDDKNYFIRTTSIGQDLVAANATNDFVFGIGNGFISSYSTEGSVGNFPKSSITVEGLNMEMEQNISGNPIPAVDPTNGTALALTYQLPILLSGPAGNPALSGISALRPGDINVSLDYNGGGVDTTDWKVQSYTLNYGISRDPQLKLGSKYAFARLIRYPLNVSCSITANVGDQKTGSLIELVNNNANYNVTIDIKKAGTSTTVCNYQLKGAKLESQNFSSSIGSSKSVVLSFSTQISASGQTSIGAFMSGWN